MRLEIKRALFLHKDKGLTEAQLFNKFVDAAAAGNVEQVMADISREYLAHFREWVYRLPSSDTLINLKAGPISEREKDAIGAIRDWLDRHPGDCESNGAAGAPLISRSDADADRLLDL